MSRKGSGLKTILKNSSTDDSNKNKVELYLLSCNLFCVNICLDSNGQFPGPASTRFLDIASTAGPTITSFAESFKIVKKV